MRGRYHAAAGFTSQFINALFAEAARVWESWGATEEDALRALMPMARGTLSSIESAGIAGGMPGPVSRGDLGSIEKHMQAMEELGEHTLGFYRVLCTSTIALAVERGSIDELAREAARLAPPLLPSPNRDAGRIVAVVEYRDGSVIDIVRAT